MFELFEVKVLVVVEVIDFECLIDLLLLFVDGGQLLPAGRPLFHQLILYIIEVIYILSFCINSLNVLSSLIRLFILS